MMENNEQNTMAIDIELPSLNPNNSDYSNLMSVGIDEALKKDKLDTVLLQEETEVHIPSYLIDMTEVGDIMPATLRALQTMISTEGDTAVYMKKGDMVGVIGYGDRHELYSRLETYINNVYSGKAKLYKNTGKGFKLVKPMDIDSVILDI